MSNGAPSHPTVFDSPSKVMQNYTKNFINDVFPFLEIWM